MPTDGATRAWDHYDAYLFDIDGTLLHCTDAVHYFAFCESLTAIAGRSLNLDGVVAHGNTDVGILRDALRLAHIPDHQWRPTLGRTRAAMGRFVQQRTADLRITVMPGVHEVLQHLRSRRAKLGVATGNLEAIGCTKLNHAGLLSYFDFAGYSDAHEHRRDVFRAALVRARTLTNSDASVCVVGDTPEDIRSARANGLDVIAVATGIYSFEELQAALPTRCLHSLTELLTAI
jgi:phosphoglycolate phosphatase